MVYKVNIKKSALKGIDKMPLKVQERMVLLLMDLQEKGPLRSEWPNFSKLGENCYHCHLTYKWIACWQNNGKNIKIEVYYAGSRENAPY